MFFLIVSMFFAQQEFFWFITDFIMHEVILFFLHESAVFVRNRFRILDQ